MLQVAVLSSQTSGKRFCSGAVREQTSSSTVKIYGKKDFKKKERKRERRI